MPELTTGEDRFAVAPRGPKAGARQRVGINRQAGSCDLHRSTTLRGIDRMDEYPDVTSEREPDLPCWQTPQPYDYSIGD